MDRFTVKCLLLAAALALIGMWFYVRDRTSLLDRASTFFEPRLANEIAPSPRPAAEVAPPSADAGQRPGVPAERGMPDLVVLDLCYKPPYVTVAYANLGNGLGERDFLVKLSTENGEFGGNRYYRFEVPPPQQVTHTGGFTIGLLGLQQGDSALVTAEIDWEGRVAESNEDNNVHSKQLLIDETPPATPCM